MCGPPFTWWQRWDHVSSHLTKLPAKESPRMPGRMRRETEWRGQTPPPLLPGMLLGPRYQEPAPATPGPSHGGRPPLEEIMDWLVEEVTPAAAGLGKKKTPRGQFQPPLPRPADGSPPPLMPTLSPSPRTSSKLPQSAPHSRRCCSHCHTHMIETTWERPLMPPLLCHQRPPRISDTLSLLPRICPRHRYPSEKTPRLLHQRLSAGRQQQEM
ncbi:unnamed protein product [Lampetra planeri]